ncbi:hypothetical protein C8R42DRAFT_647107 [Lentinula raphanica]|nr:hypothetical protein C8R42DRAFT_647107 [Lentinula raphanica]
MGNATPDFKSIPSVETAYKMGMRIFEDEVMGMDSDNGPEEVKPTKSKKPKKKKHVSPPTSESEDSSNESSSGSDSEVEPKPKKKTVKQEVRTKIVEKSPAESIDDLACQLRSLNVHDVNYAGVYAQVSNCVIQMGRWFYWPDGHPQARQVIQDGPNTATGFLSCQTVAAAVEVTVEANSNEDAREESEESLIEATKSEEVKDETMEGDHSVASGKYPLYSG